MKYSRSNSSRIKLNNGGRATKDWLHLYSIYGSDDWHTVFFLLFNSLLFASISVVILIYFSSILKFVSSHFPSVPFVQHAISFIGILTALTSICLLYASIQVLYSSLPLRFEIARKMVLEITDWSSVRTALDVGCNRGVLLNTVAKQMKKEGSSGTVIGLDKNKDIIIEALRRASVTGVQKYVTCREGDKKELPFGDAYFDVVVTGLGLGKEREERAKELSEMVRVLRGGGVGVIWDMVNVRDVFEKLKEMRMEDIRVSGRVTVYMVSSRIVSFRKPETTVEAAPLDWRANIC